MILSSPAAPPAPLLTHVDTRKGLVSSAPWGTFTRQTNFRALEKKRHRCSVVFSAVNLQDGGSARAAAHRGQPRGQSPRRAVGSHVGAWPSLTSASPRASPWSPGTASPAAATRTARRGRGSAGSRRHGGSQGALQGREALGDPPNRAVLRGPPVPRRGPTLHQQPQRAQAVAAHEAAVGARVLVAQAVQGQRVPCGQPLAPAPLLRPPGHGDVPWTLVPAPQRDVRSGAAQHRVLGEPWGA